MLFLIKLVRLGLFLLLAVLWAFYGEALLYKLSYPNYKNLDGAGFLLAGSLLALFSAFILRNFHKLSC
jgi:hypothetical protein